MPEVTPSAGAMRTPGERPGPVLVDVIGTVAVARAGRTVAGHALGGRRARLVLVALALAGGPVSADRLAAMVWAGEPPPTWPAALRGVVGGLRAALATIGAGGQRVIGTEPSAYCLATGVEVDLDQAELALRSAAMLAEQGRPEGALALAEPVAALSGERLLPGEDAAWLGPHRARADAAALRALELVASSAGALGDHHRAVDAGRRAVAASPLDERAHRILIRALHAGGDRAAVVRAYEACRALLADQLGVDPDPETIAVYLAALGDAGSSAPSGVAGAARLPQVRSAFFGRDVEAALLGSLLREPGLVTVAGKGGVGKSRLALRVARSQAFAGGKLWVSLAAVSQDELVAATVAMALGLPVGTDDPAALLADHLAPLGRVLLVLDGCEAVVDGTASLVTSLLALCPTLSVVVTSRMPLAAEGERLVGVDPLVAGDQVRLLADRVRGSGGELVIDEATVPFVEELCRRCGGLPLALELAAAQLAAMSVPDLLDHLPELIADGEDRLRGVAASSYALLDDDEATVFRRFGVLDGPVALPVVRHVVAGETIPPVRIVRILRELTARGLLGVDRSGPRWRYYQDDDLHSLARELLDAAGEAAQATARLADALSEIIPADPRAAPEPYAQRVGEVLPCIRTMLGAAIAGRLSRDRGLELAFRLHRYWAATNVSEGRFWLSRLLADVLPAPGEAPPGEAAPGEAPPGEAARGSAGQVAAAPAWAAYATYALGYLSYWSGDTAEAEAELQAAVDLLGGRPDAYAARALIYLGGLADDRDRCEEAIEFVRRSIVAAAPFGVDLQVGAAIGMGCVLAERADRGAAGCAAAAIELCRGGGSEQQLAATLPTAAMVCWQVGDLAAARRYVAEAMPLLAGSRRIARVVLFSVAAGIALADGDFDAAVELGTTADSDASELGIERELPLVRCILARALLARGDLDEAAGAALRAIEAARSLTFAFPLATCLETAALVSLRGGVDHRIADQMLVAAAEIRDRGDRPGPVTMAAAVARARAIVHRATESGPAAGLGLAATVALATAALGEPAVSQPASGGAEPGRRPG